MAKHRTNITLIILGLFLLTQFIGLFVIDTYCPAGDVDCTNLPAYFGSNENTEISAWSFIPSFIFAILLIMLIMKYKQKWVMRIWFTAVVIMALFLAINAIFLRLNIALWYLALILAIPLALLKLFRPNKYTHNLTELFIYPGIAAVFVPILGIWSMVVVLILISLYDIWAVWHSGLMQKMAKFQMEEVGIFGGLIIPSISKSQRKKIKEARKAKDPKRLGKMKVGMAILGGGDIIFPLIAAGVFMVQFSSIIPALFIITGAFLGLTYLLTVSEKTKFYPAMPFISFGIFAGLALWRILFF